MGICAECIYIGDKKSLTDRCDKRRFSENFVCNCLDNAETDYITGEIILSSCRIKNQFGECLFFDDGKIDVHYYAWKKEDSLIYTRVETPTEDDKYLDQNLENESAISSIENIYGWTNEETLYTKTDSPTLSDTVFSQYNELLGDIEAVEDDKLTFNDIEYTRDEEKDSLFVNGYYRSVDNDIIRREDKPEEETPEEPDEEPDDSEDIPEDPDATI